MGGIACWRPLAVRPCSATRLWQHLAETNAILKEKRDAVFVGLEENAGDLCTWSRPVGGMFLWIEFPEEVDRDRLMALCAERGIVVARGQGFHIRREDVPAIRPRLWLCLAGGGPRRGVPAIGRVHPRGASPP